MYNLQNSPNSEMPRINGLNHSKTETDGFPIIKSVRISDETFYFGSNNSDSLRKGITSGKESPDSTYFSSIISDISEGAENGKVSFN